MEPVRKERAAAMTVRRHVYYSGHVQGVGFRYAVREAARGLPVTGFVRNLSDGRVEAVAEGDAPAVEALLDAVAEEMRAYITDAEVLEEPPTGEFPTFGVRF